MPIRPYPGMEIDGFVLGEKLHQGAFATIWDVTHPAHDTPLVMKVPIIMDGYDGPTIVGFEVEQMIMPRLSGPHVPRLIGAGDFSVMPYIVTEKIQGESLMSVFKHAPLPLSDVLAISARMVKAVVELHRQHVIHLDLKPENLMQRPALPDSGGEIVLIDFGLSRHDLLPDLLAEEFSIPMGTYPYIAPEQYLRCRNDLRSDLFALGAMMYELSTGKLPFGMPQKLRGVRKRLWCDPLPPRALRPEVPEWLQEIILRALEVDPARRYQTAEQLAFDLAYPLQIKLTHRAMKLRQDSFLARFHRWRAVRKLRQFASVRTMTAQLASVQIICVAVDLAPAGEALAEILRGSIQQILVLQPDARIACVTVLKTARIGIDQATDDAGNNLHVVQLVALREWAVGVDLPQDQLTFAVLESPDPGRAIIDYATANHVNHIVLGARGHSTARRYLGSVSAQVVAEAHCSVTVIRVPDKRTDAA